MSLVSFLNNLFKYDGFELIDSNSKKYIIGKPTKNIEKRILRFVEILRSQMISAFLLHIRMSCKIRNQFGAA